METRQTKQVAPRRPDFAAFGDRPEYPSPEFSAKAADYLEEAADLVDYVHHTLALEPRADPVAMRPMVESARRFSFVLRSAAMGTPGFAADPRITAVRLWKSLRISVIGFVYVRYCGGPGEISPGIRECSGLVKEYERILGAVAWREMAEERAAWQANRAKNADVYWTR